MYAETSWPIMNKILKEKYHMIIFDPHEVAVSTTRFTIINSGLYIASKYAIIRSKFYSYKNVYSRTKLACKGVLFAELQIGDNESIIVGNTHLQEPIGDFIKGIKDSQ